MMLRGGNRKAGGAVVVDGGGGGSSPGRGSRARMRDQELAGDTSNNNKEDGKVEARKCVNGRGRGGARRRASKDPSKKISGGSLSGPQKVTTRGRSSVKGVVGIEGLELVASGLRSSSIRNMQQPPPVAIISASHLRQVADLRKKFETVVDLYMEEAKEGEEEESPSRDKKAAEKSARNKKKKEAKKKRRQREHEDEDPAKKSTNDEDDAAVAKKHRHRDHDAKKSNKRRRHTTEESPASSEKNSSRKSRGSQSSKKKADPNVVEIDMLSVQTPWKLLKVKVDNKPHVKEALQSKEEPASREREHERADKNKKKNKRRSTEKMNDEDRDAAVGKSARLMDGKKSAHSESDKKETSKKVKSEQQQQRQKKDKKERPSKDNERTQRLKEAKDKEAKLLADKCEAAKAAMLKRKLSLSKEELGATGAKVNRDEGPHKKRKVEANPIDSADGGINSHQIQASAGSQPQQDIPPPTTPAPSWSSDINRENMDLNSQQLQFPLGITIGSSQTIGSEVANKTVGEARTPRNIQKERVWPRKSNRQSIMIEELENEENAVSKKLCKLKRPVTPPAAPTVPVSEFSWDWEYFGPGVKWEFSLPDAKDAIKSGLSENLKLYTGKICRVFVDFEPVPVEPNVLIRSSLIKFCIYTVKRGKASTIRIATARIQFHRTSRATFAFNVVDPDEVAILGLSLQVLLASCSAVFRTTLVPRNEDLELEHDVKETAGFLVESVERKEYFEELERQYALVPSTSAAAAELEAYNNNQGEDNWDDDEPVGNTPATNNGTQVKAAVAVVPAYAAGLDVAPSISAAAACGRESSLNNNNNNNEDNWDDDEPAKSVAPEANVVGRENEVIQVQRQAPAHQENEAIRVPPARVRVPYEVIREQGPIPAPIVKYGWMPNCSIM